MQAIELDAVITQNHEIHLKLPDDVKAGHAKVIVGRSRYRGEKPRHRLIN